MPAQAGTCSSKARGFSPVSLVSIQLFMNILFVTQNYLPFTGGIELQTQMAAQALSRRHRVAVAAMNFAPCRLPKRLATLHNSLLAPAFADYRDGEVPVHALTPRFGERLRLLPIAVRALPVIQRHAFHGLSRFGYPAFRAVYVPRLRRLMAGVDVVHCQCGGYLGWAAAEAAHSLGLPVVCTPYVHPRQWGDGPDDVAYYKRCRAVIALLESDRQNLASIGVPESLLRVIGVVPIVSPTTDPVGFREKHGLADMPFVLYVGRMTEYKGFRAILEAGPEIWKHVPEARLVFAGPAGPAEAAAFENADPRILFLGRCSDQEKSDALAACDLFCMPSTSEILPTVYLEAWSYGKPIIGGRAPGLPELIEGSGGGETVEQASPAVAKSIIRFLTDPALRTWYGESGRRRVAQSYSVEAVTGQLEALYSELTETRVLQPV